MSASPKQERTPPIRGIRQGFTAFCRPCDWHGVTWYGNGSGASAAADLAEHKQRAGHATDGRRDKTTGKPCKHATDGAPICAQCVKKRKQVADRYQRLKDASAGDGAKPAKTEPPSEVALRRGNRVGDGSRTGGVNAALRVWGAR
jgi:hypothetical protein